MRVLLTRYNIASEDQVWEARRAAPGWLPLRLKLFEGFCLPSVLMQVERPDLWLIGFDGEDRDLVAPVLETVRRHPWIAPAWQAKADGRHESVVRSFRREIEERFSGEFAYVISSRLDSDDALHRDFIKDATEYSAAVLSRQPELENFWVSFPNGATFQKGVCRFRAYPANPFLTRVQTVAHFRSSRKPTAMVGGHTKVFKRGPVFLAITPEPMWLQNVHGGNIRNRRGNLPTFASADKILQSCGVKPAAKRPWRRAGRRAKRLLRWFRRSPPAE